MDLKEKYSTFKSMSSFPVRIEEIFDQNDVMKSIGKVPSSSQEQELNSKVLMQRTFIRYFDAENEHEAIILAKEWCKNQKEKRYSILNT